MAKVICIPFLLCLLLLLIVYTRMRMHQLIANLAVQLLKKILVLLAIFFIVGIARAEQFHLPATAVISSVDVIPYTPPPERHQLVTVDRAHDPLTVTVIGFYAAHGHQWGSLFPQFYDHSCPQAKEIVSSVVSQAVARETRMAAASLARLHFHDCFVQGCDASLLLDNSSRIVSEKGSNPNRNSARGFEVVDEIKAALEHACPGTVSCADILALAARDSTLLVGGPYWDVPLGRRDSLGASIQGSNNDIPAPNNTLPTIITKFKRQGLDLVDVVALSGAHTIGFSRCTSFRQRLYNQSGNGMADATLDVSYAAHLRQGCPRSGGDNNLFPLDIATPARFDNMYFKNILAGRGLLSSDEVLLTKSAETAALVKAYAADVNLFFQHFAQSMVKMGNVSPLTGAQGEVRKNCRRVNGNHY